MNLIVHGAAGGEVTGSAYLLQTSKASVLVDCGLFQGAKTAEKLNVLPRGAGFQKLNAVVLTHGHLDHLMALPGLVGRRRT